MDELIHERQPTQIAHVLFLDIVGYSKETIASQGRLVTQLTDAVRGAATYQAADVAGQVLALPTGDGMAILFFGDLAAPARCALEIAGQIESTPLKVRMGLHSGPIQRQQDITGKENVVGEAINTAQRVMDFGEEGHILASSQYAAWLRQFDEWQDLVKELGRGVTKHGDKLSLFRISQGCVGRIDAPGSIRNASMPTFDQKAAQIAIVYKRNAHPDDQLLSMLESALREMGHQVFIDRHLKIGVEWANIIEEKIRGADAVIAILSDSALGSEMLEYELETAFDENKRRGKPFLLPIRVGTDQPISGPVGTFLNGLNFSVWRSPSDDRCVLEEIVAALTEQPESQTEFTLEPVGGAVPADSAFYVERSTDQEFFKALRANESILLVKGPRQVGKTSLLGRGTKLVREFGWRHVSTDFQKLSASHLTSPETCYRVMAATLSRQLKFSYDFDNEWDDVFGANMNMDNFICSLLESSDKPLVWFMDEADKLFGVPFASDFFGLVRSWHNSRAGDPGGPWARFTVVIGYATEAHLFIQELNQSPFNVGRQLPLQSFTLTETEDLNQRYQSPVQSEQVEQLWRLISGQPFLTRRALDVLARGEIDFPMLLLKATEDDGPFGDHLKRILISVSQIPAVLEALRAPISGSSFKDSEGVQRLIAAGVARKNGDRIELSCPLYRDYLSRHLH